MHVKIKLSHALKNSTSSPTSGEYVHKSEQYEGLNYYDEQNLKLKLCKGADVAEKSSNEMSISEFEASLADEDVITFFNSHIYQNPPFFSLEILREANQTFSYCVELKTYEKKLPFVCKVDLDDAKSEKHFYTNSLKNYQQDPKMSYVMNSLLAIVNGLDKVHQNVNFIY